MVNARAYAFGSFLLVPERQLLMRDEAPVRIGTRALDILTALVERAGELVPKDDLMARAWPTTTVEESNLKVHIAALRRTLGDDAGAARYIATAPGRGYRFIAPVETGAAPGQGMLETDLIRCLLDGAGYGVVVDGEITLRLGETILLLKPGSVVARAGHIPAMASQPDRRGRVLFVPVDWK